MADTYVEMGVPLKTSEPTTAAAATNWQLKMGKGSGLNCEVPESYITFCYVKSGKAAPYDHRVDGAKILGDSQTFKAVAK